MSKYRIVEQPFGTFRVERKGWFFWHPICLHKSDAGRWLLVRGEPNFWASPIWHPPIGAVYSFRSESDAADALREAIPETAYRRVVPL